MDRRIYGLETEYGITCAATDGSASPLNAEQAARELFAPFTKRGRSTNAFLANGGRLYLDVGAHPEYATAECDNLWDLLVQDRAGCELLADMAATADQSLAQAGIQARIHLLRNNFDYEGNSFGCHENYLLRRRRDFREVADSLVAFFVTRQILVGAGAIKQYEDGQWAYCFSARSDQMLDAISAATTRARPIINARDEPLADASAYRRMHVIVGDSNMAEASTALKVGSAELLLDALDRGADLADLALADPLKAIRDLNWDLEGTLELEMADGTKKRAVDIQRLIRQRVLDRIDQSSLDDITRYVVELWGRSIDAIDSGDWSAIETELDFAIKRKLVEAYSERTGAQFDDVRVTRLLLDYHDVTGGLRSKFESAGLMTRLTTEELIEAGKTTPPQTTRAILRGKAIAAAEIARRDLGVDWVHLRLEGDSTTQVALQDPFATEDSRVERLVEEIIESQPILPA
ncbi:Pup--protein ligase [Actinomycetaceae bacterium WB03_NA08]|uniref:Pup--protein ligase n=1 Tax=Scrofimicrobium canadense TaxID=2652290 RepID=A0A6N7W6E7_9ACTO|nr:proteasome accessory factor PafA2 family protein [Scrofimicrobium canadense]MSS84002.1 Pup--protein ligase [Scrofimicrobium canadense]